MKSRNIFAKLLMFIGFVLLSTAFFLSLPDFVYNIKANVFKNKSMNIDYNQYTKVNQYHYVSNVSINEVRNYDELHNLYYTFINSGMDNFTFKCSFKYKSCLKDATKLSKDRTKISYLNSFVHPFNSFNELKTNINYLGFITLHNKKSYSDSEIEAINLKVQEVDRTIVKGEKDKRKIIKLIHDYITKNTEYEENDQDDSVNTAYGALINKKALCGGYTDAFAIFMDYYDIPNFKVTSELHTWNAVLLDGKWYHVDTTWDDPVNINGIIYKYFLREVDYSFEKEKDHQYNKEVYKELIY